GFVMVVADDPDGRLAGFAFGFTFERGLWWKDATPEPPGLLGLALFAVMELAVRPAFRGRGIATALMTQLLSDRSERYATFATSPVAVARQIYAGWGWQRAGTVTAPDGSPADILIRPL